MEERRRKKGEKVLGLVPLIGIHQRAWQLRWPKSEPTCRTRSRPLKESGGSRYH